MPPIHHLRRTTWRGVGLAVWLASSLSVAAQPPSASFPTVDGATQRVRDDTRRRILLAELAAEQQALREAQQDLAAVVAHQRNIEAIHSELARLPGRRLAEPVGIPAGPVVLRREEPPPAPPTEPPAPWWDVYARNRAPRR